MRSKKERIFIDGDVLVGEHFSGIGHYTLEIIKAIDRELEHNKSISVNVFVYFRHLKKMKQYRLKNIKVIPSPFSLRISNGLKIREMQPPLDLFFGSGYYMFPNFSSWPLLKKSKNIPIIYDISYEKYPEFADPKNQEFLSNQVRHSIARADIIGTISNSAKKEICDYYDVPGKKVSVYYPAVDKEVFYKRPESEVNAAKEKYGLPKNYILFVGNIEPRKNLKNLLLAYERLHTTIKKSYPLVLVGAKGWQDSEIFDIISRVSNGRGKIIFPRQYISDEDLPAIYSGAEIFVYPSIYEGFGIPPIEAMACELPVICADNSSLPEAVGDAALLIDAHSVDDITSTITQLLNNSSLRNELRKKGLNQIKKFSWDKTAKQLLDDILKAKP